MARVIIWLMAWACCMPATAKIVTYTENVHDDTHIALGFPVPIPANNTSAFAGFRSYTALINRLTALSALSDRLERVTVGTSLNGNPIYGFRYGTVDRSAMLHVAGMHAREWIGPEAATYIIEQLESARSERGIEQFLSDTTSVLLIPVLNPDAYMATQTHADQTRTGEDSNSTASTPRDGRMRRKNLRDSDGDLSTPADTLLGVDLNRNIGPFWNLSARSSPNQQSIIYHGSSESSEPETTALKQALTKLGNSELRLFLDTHSYGRVYFYNDTGASRLTTITRDLGNLIRLAPPQSYQLIVEEPLHQGIGAADEYFAYELKVPSYTLEIEPGSEREAAEYGGNVVDHSGFILPDAEVPRVRDEVYQMARLAYYRQAGPAILESVRITNLQQSQLVFEGRWNTSADSKRKQQQTQNVGLIAGQTYRMELKFSKPMRIRDSNGQITSYPGLSAPSEPVIILAGDQREQLLNDSTAIWSDGKYQADTYRLDFVLPEGLGSRAQLHVTLKDLSNQELDGKPATIVSWRDGHWEGWENAAGLDTDFGGDGDRSFCIALGADADGCTARGSSGGSGWPYWLTLLLLGHMGMRRR